MAPNLDHAVFNPEFCRNMFTACTSGFDGAVMPGLTIDTLEPGVCICSVPVTAALINKYKMMHGGAIATFIDTITTAALVTINNVAGVSVNLNTTYLAPAPLGCTVEIEGRVVKVGRILATMTAEVRLKPGGQVVATGSHTKFIMATGFSKL